jgi:hypothetical protein
MEGANEHEGKLNVALEIAIVAGVLQRCDSHDDFVFQGNNDIEDAYQVGNARFTAGNLRGTFESRREMTDLIKEVVNDHPAGECPYPPCHMEMETKNEF